MIETKTAPRRALAFRSIDELKSELDRLEAAHNGGTLTHTGNWTAGMIFDHLGKFGTCAIDGFESGPPAPVRWMLTLLFKKKALSGEPMPSGFKLPAKANFLLPTEGMGFDEGITRLRAVFARIEGGERFAQPSPVFGKLTHDQWMVMQLGHAAMHLGFLDPGV